MGKEEPPAPEFPPQAPVAPPRKVLDMVLRLIVSLIQSKPIIR